MENHVALFLLLAVVIVICLAFIVAIGIVITNLVARILKNEPSGFVRGDRFSYTSYLTPIKGPGPKYVVRILEAGLEELKKENGILQAKVDILTAKVDELLAR